MLGDGAAAAAGWGELAVWNKGAAVTEGCCGVEPVTGGGWEGDGVGEGVGAGAGAGLAVMGTGLAGRPPQMVELPPCADASATARDFASACAAEGYTATTCQMGIRSCRANQR